MHQRIANFDVKSFRKWNHFKNGKKFDIFLTKSVEIFFNFLLLFGFYKRNFADFFKIVLNSFNCQISKPSILINLITYLCFSLFRFLHFIPFPFDGSSGQNQIRSVGRRRPHLHQSVWAPRLGHQGRHGQGRLVQNQGDRAQGKRVDR